MFTRKILPIHLQSQHYKHTLLTCLKLVFSLKAEAIEKNGPTNQRNSHQQPAGEWGKSPDGTIDPKKIM